MKSKIIFRFRNAWTWVQQKLMLFRNAWTGVLQKGVLQKIMLVVLFLSINCFCAFADTGAGAGALNEVSSTLKTYLVPTQNVIYAIAGVVALVGSISVFIKMNNEDQDIKKSIMLLVGSCVFLVAAAKALPLFFE